jgi:predicted kinase
MKSLSLDRPLVIMMIGRPGAGKSFFARQFSATFGAPLVSFDRLRFELFTQPTYSVDEQDILERIALYQIEELLKTNKTFIVDGGCNTKAARMYITKVAKMGGYNTLAIWTQTDDLTCKIRATKRSPRRADDAYNISLTPEQFVTLSRRVAPPTAIEPHIVISGKHTYTAQARAVLKRLVEPRASETTIHVDVAAPKREHPTSPRITPPVRNITIR